MRPCHGRNYPYEGIIHRKELLIGRNNSYQGITHMKEFPI